MALNSWLPRTHWAEPELDHRPHDIDCFQLARPAIDQIADENRLSLGMLPNPVDPAIAENFEEAEKLPGLPMDIADDIERLAAHFSHHP